jgi:hypothetical protein
VPKEPFDDDEVELPGVLVMCFDAEIREDIRLRNPEAALTSEIGDLRGLMGSAMEETPPSGGGEAQTDVHELALGLPMLFESPPL